MDLIKGCLHKSYDNKIIFNDIAISIQVGEIYLVIGRNGIGKSTLLRLIAGVEDSYSLEFQIDESEISYMPSDLIYYHNMRVKDLLIFYRDFYYKFSIKYAIEYLKEFNIKMNQKIKKLSDGQRKMLSYVICLSFSCSLYVIDEPFPNVDLLNNEIFRRMILDRYTEKTTFVIATHEINELEKLASQCLFIKNVNKIETFNIDEIRDEKSLSIEDYFKEALK